MRNFESDKLKMYMTVAACMNKNTGLWQTLPYLADSVTLLNTNINVIGHNEAIQTEDLSGYALQKKNKRQDLETIALFVAMQLKSYAMVNQNESLFNQMKYTPTGFKQSRAKDLVFDAGTILTTATENMPAIINFGITQAVLDDMQTKIGVFAGLLNAPADERNAQKDATAIIKKTIRETDTLLKHRLDYQMLVFKETEPVFYTNYILDRKINSSPTIKLAMRCLVVDAATNKPLPGALVTLKDHNIKRKTSPNGQILIRNLKEGKHTVSIVLAGYQPATSEVTHIKGETTLVTVDIVKSE